MLWKNYNIQQRLRFNNQLQLWLSECQHIQTTTGEFKNALNSFKASQLCNYLDKDSWISDEKETS